MLAADVATPSIVRDRIRRWLEGMQWPSEATDDIEMAVNEAVSNAVQHAYPPGTNGLIRLQASVEQVPGGRRRARIVVRDDGRRGAVWPGRGRGLLIMKALLAEVVITHDPEQGGTAATMLSTSVPVPDG